jgi:hypothetical protein
MNKTFNENLKKIHELSREMGEYYCTQENLNLEEISLEWLKILRGYHYCAVGMMKIACDVIIKKQKEQEGGENDSN